ncbi:cilia and flagella associated protein 20 [Phyllostomus discolor]|uniref:Cilia and flagella associated protein 20 n=1 Tax=Phyllostomus discolor TaxID=89673 RepID=A0A833YGS0_9CHIR|nr:cilia and flagella associated protein 20 [Phyllostomus discolor]
MFKNTFQSGFLSILYSIGSKPLQIWDKKVRNGHIKRITDNDIQSLVLEIEGTNVSTTYITCPADPKKTLGIKLPFLVMIIKNLKKYFTFEVQVLDDKNVRRRFRASNYQSTTRVKPFICTMPMRLDEGWNQIQFNLSDFTRRAYGTNYIETLRVQVPGPCPDGASDGRGALPRQLCPCGAREGFWLKLPRACPGGLGPRELWDALRIRLRYGGRIWQVALPLVRVQRRPVRGGAKGMEL